MTGHTTEVLIVTLASGVVSGIAVTLVQEVFQSRARAASVKATRTERAAEVREQRRRESARIVGPALAVLRDLEPGANVMALRSNTDQTRKALLQKWESWLAASGELQVLGATHPDSDVDRLCQSVIDKGTDLLARIQWGIYEGAQEEAWWTATKAAHAEATTDARSLVRSVLDQPA